MMPFPFRQTRSVLMLCAVLGGVSSASSLQAGLIPWAYNSVFGYGPVFPGRYGYAPAYGYGNGIAMGPTAMPVSSYYGPSDWGWGGFAGYGYGGSGNCNPCGGCSPCGNSCDPCGGGCSNCADQCGSSYAPAPQNNSPSEPTPASPKPAPPANPNPPANRNDVPTDDFRPARPLDNSSPSFPNNTIPGGNSTIPRGTPPSGGSPAGSGNPGGGTIPGGSSIPGGGTIPGGSTPGGGTIPGGSTLPDSGLPPLNPNTPATDGTERLFRMPLEDRAPAPSDPVPTDALSPMPEPAPDNNSELPEPLELKPNVQIRPMPTESRLGLVAELKIRRQRVILDRADDQPSVTRMTVLPRPTIEATADVLARK